MRPQQLCFLQTPFKMKAAKSASKTPGLPTAQAGGGFMAAASALSMLVPQTAMYGHSTPIRLKPAHPTLPLAANFLLSLDQQFHSTACALKSEDGGKGSNNGDKPTQNNSSDEHGSGVEPTQQQQRGKRGQSLGDANAVRQRLPKCKDCGAPLRNTQRTENINSNLLECSNCGTIYARSAGGPNAYHQILDRKMEERMRIQTPREIKAYLDQYVIGQDHAKHHLALGVYEHYIRVHNNEQFRSNTSNMAESKFAAALPQQPGHVRPINEFSQDILLFVVMSSRGGSGTFIPQSMSQQKQQTLKKKTPALFHSPSPIHHHSGEQHSGVKMEKSNILLLGPSGVGKTHMVKVLAEALDVPMAQCDCTSLTQAGYVGEDVESVLQKLLQEADGDIQKAQHGIVYLDEFDKISMKESANSASNRDVGGEGVQHAMLKMVEGTVVTVPKNRKGQGPQEAVSLDTTDILFIASGAFTGIEKYISRRLEKKTMGFGSTQSANTITMDDKEQAEINAKRDRLLKQVRSEDVINFGMIPELVGRFPTRVPFHSLDKNSLKRVLTEPKNSLMDQAKMFFSWHNAKLEVTDEALDEIAHLALKEKVGARALISHLYQVLWESKYELPGSDIDTVRITAEYVRGEGRYEVILKDRGPASAAQHNNNKQQVAAAAL